MLISENIFIKHISFKDKSFEMYFLREQFWSAPVFWNVFF